MDDFDDPEQLRADIIELFPPGQARDFWLKWVDQMIAESASPARQRTLH
jgi:hypothetical protein